MLLFRTLGVMLLWGVVVVSAWIPPSQPQGSSFSSIQQQHQPSQPQEGDSSTQQRLLSLVTASPSRSVSFSALMTLSGAALGPFLDSFHSAFGVLEYHNTPITAQLWGSSDVPALITTWWVPELFGLAGFLIGWLYLVIDTVLYERPLPPPSPPTLILVGISFFTFQYWLSGWMFHAGVDRQTILYVMSASAAVGFAALDRTLSGFWTSAATAIGGPLIEVGLLQLSRSSEIFGDGYHYIDGGETGFFPLWIVPVYFLGGPANGNLARGYWSALSELIRVPEAKVATDEVCEECKGTRCSPCPNCDGLGTYMAMGNREVVCTSCRGRGFVVCRACFDRFDEDPEDIEGIRELMASMPD